MVRVPRGCARARGEGIAAGWHCASRPPAAPLTPCKAGAVSWERNPGITAHTCKQTQRGKSNRSIETLHETPDGLNPAGLLLAARRCISASLPPAFPLPAFPTHAPAPRPRRAPGGHPLGGCKPAARPRPFARRGGGLHPGCLRAPGTL